MRNARGTRHSLPYNRKLTVIAQDPSIKTKGKILTTDLDVPAEVLLPGPTGYRVKVIDFDATSNALYSPAEIDMGKATSYEDPYSPKRFEKKPARVFNDTLIEDPRFHAQNVYAIVMRTLARFEFALGRRVAWGSPGHQLHIAPHAFAQANAFYSRADRAIFFGYFTGQSGRTIYTALAHDVVAHETTHALLDGLRARYMEPSSPDQAAFHEGFADIVALLSIFSLKDVVGTLIDLGTGGGKLVSEKKLDRTNIMESALLGLADEMGQELSGIRGDALRRSVRLAKGKSYMDMAEYREPHTRGELIVAAVMNAFVDIWLSRLEKVGTLTPGMKDRSLVVEQGATVADHLLTMCIRALDYCPPTDITFSDYLSALLTIDREVVPDDSNYRYRHWLLKNFTDYGIKPAEKADADGTWKRCDEELVYSRSHFDSMLRDKEEVARFLWENSIALNLNSDAYFQVESVRPCSRIGPDGFILRETVAEYVQIITLTAGELEKTLGIKVPHGMPDSLRVTAYGGGALIFNEYGQLKYQIPNRIEDAKRQTARLRYLWESGYFDSPPDPASHFALMHLKRAGVDGGF